MSFPANAAGFFGYIIEVAAFELFEIGDTVNDILELPPTAPLTEKLEAIGLESKYFINNLGFFFLIILGFTCLLLSWVLLWPFQQCSKRVRKLRKRIANTLFWNGSITTVFESFMMLVLNGLIVLRHNFSFGTWGE